jgi:hypothetical protein
LDPRDSDGEVLRRVRERQELLIELERDALLDVVVWARRPVQRSASKEELATHIAGIQQADFSGLSHRGLYALARLRGLPVGPAMDAAAIRKRLRESESLWQRVRRRRRAFVGTLVGKFFHEGSGQAEQEYRFLPEDPRTTSLKAHIEEEGMMGGIARKLRGVADDYVREKLDEIEERIDRKLDEIDRRLAEWRDQEVSNRLKIIKVTLVVSIIVAALSLGYDYVRRGAGWRAGSSTPAPMVDEAQRDRADDEPTSPP